MIIPAKSTGTLSWSPLQYLILEGSDLAVDWFTYKWSTERDRWKLKRMSTTTFRPPPDHILHFSPTLISYEETEPAHGSLRSISLSGDGENEVLYRLIATVEAWLPEGLTGIYYGGIDQRWYCRVPFGGRKGFKPVFTLYWAPVIPTVDTTDFLLEKKKKKSSTVKKTAVGSWFPQKKNTTGIDRHIYGMLVAHRYGDPRYFFGIRESILEKDGDVFPSVTNGRTQLVLNPKIFDWNPLSVLREEPEVFSTVRNLRERVARWQKVQDDDGFPPVPVVEYCVLPGRPAVPYRATGSSTRGVHKNEVVEFTFTLEKPSGD